MMNRKNSVRAICLLLLLTSSLAPKPSNAFNLEPFIAKLSQLTNPQTPEEISANSQCSKTCKVSSLGVSLIQGFEGFSPFVYADVGKIPTIGFGHAVLPGERFNEPISGEEASQLLAKDIAKRTPHINLVIRVPLKQAQFDALASFVYNVGTGSFDRSTLLKRINTGSHSTVPSELLKWDKVQGKVVMGLKYRRKAEGALYVSTD